MEASHAIILGIVQGITEFLPISSSGHLALLQNYLGEVNVSFDIIVHLATLLAIVLYFFKDIAAILRDFLTFKKESENFKLAVYLILATLPALVVGLLLGAVIERTFSSLLVVGVGFFISGIFLIFASRLDKENTQKMSVSKSLVIGCAQALALIPGISRSGSTVSTGVLFGLQREKAIKFSFLLAIPVIIGAIVVQGAQIPILDFRSAALGFISAFVFGFFSIFLFIRKITVRRLKWFAIYCFILGALSLVLYFL